MKRHAWWLVLAVLVLSAMNLAAPAQAQVVINGVSQGSAYSVPSTGLTATSESINYFGGTLSQSQGSNSSSTLDVGVGDPSYPFFAGLGTYDLSGGNLTATTETLGIGNGNGVFDQTNGTNTVGTGGLSVLGQSAANGTLAGSADYQLIGGTLIAPLISIGESSVTDHATFEFGGGVADFAQMQIYQGSLVTASANEVLDAANAVNTAPIVTQVAGTNTVTGTFELGATGTTVITNGVVTGYTPNNDTYSLKGGSLSAANEQLGIGGNAQFTQSGGTNTVLTGGTLTIGSAGIQVAPGIGGGGVASYDLSGGVLTAPTISVAQSGTLQFNGGTIDFGQLVSHGTLSASGNEVLDSINAVNTAPIVTQVAGTNTVTGTFELGATGTTVITNGVVTGYTPNNDTYSLKGGSLSAANEQLGIGGNAQFTQSGGTNTVLTGGTLTIGSAGIQVAPGIGGGGVASYDLSGGVLTAPTISVAQSGTLQFNGGTIDFGQLVSHGTLSASGNEVLDRAGATNTTYQVTELTGTNTVAGALEVGASGTTGSGGSFTANSGIYNLESGATLRAGGEVIGLAGTGTLEQTGGTNTISGSGAISLSDGTTLAAGTLMLGDNAGSSGTYTLSGTSSQLTAGVEVVGNNGTGSFVQQSGTNTVGSLVIAQGGGTGTYALQGGTLSGTVAVSAYGTFELSGGSLAGGIVNNGVFAETGGGSTGALTNNATATVAGTLTASQVTNASQFTLNGGTVTTTGGFENDSTLSGHGSIVGTGGFLNTNLFTQSGGSFTLSATGTNNNAGEIDLAAGTTTPFQIAAGSTLANNGLINLNGGTLSGFGTLDNATGVIDGGGRIATALFSNQGTLNAGAGLTSLSGTVINGGIIDLGAANALLIGSNISNDGTIEGQGQINNGIGDSGGTIQASGGTLILGGVVTTTKQTTLIANTGAQLQLTAALANIGTVSLAGGSFDDTSAQGVTNNGTISGYGAFGASGLTNNHTILVAGGTATFNTAVTNNLGGTITVDHAAAVFNGAVTNNGTIHTNFGTASYAGTFTNNGTVISDPSTQTFAGDLVEGTTGVIQAAAGDRYVVEGGFLNSSTQNTAWNTSGAILAFAAGGASALHTLALAGADLGAGAAGYQNNFAWNTLALDANQSLTLTDGISAANVAFYTDVLSGAVISGNSISNITGNDFNIYYNPLFAANAYLGGLTYNLASGGQLIADSVPTPEPAAGVLLAGFVLILAGLRPRRR
jgi:hypothetical protein